MRKTILTSLFLIFAALTTLHAAIGEWQVYNSYRYATSCRAVGDRLYVLSAGALYTYDKEDGEIRTYDHVNTLSDVRIAAIDYSSAIDALVIAYENANVDILYSDESVYNISDFKNKTLATKRINNIQVVDSLAYISTDFGIVTLNLKKREFSSTYTLNQDVVSTALYGGYLYACTNIGLYRGKLTDNLLDKKNWKQLFNNPHGAPYAISALECFGDKLYCILPKLGFYSMDADGRLTLLLRNENGVGFSYLNIGERMLVGTPTKLYVYDSAGESTSFALDGSSLYVHEDGTDLWSCNGAKGVSRMTVKGDKLETLTAAIQPESPIRNHCEYLAFSPNGQLLVAGGNLNYFDITFYDGTAMTFDGDEWLNFEEEEVKSATGLNYQNITSLVEDPAEKGHYYASSFGYGLYEFRDGKFVKHYNHENSGLESVKSSGSYRERYVRVPRLKYDSNGNLWMTNTGTKDIIKVLKADGTWQPLHYDAIAKHPTMVEMLFDSRGWLWVTSLQADAGLFCAKMNGTPLDTSDDETKLITEVFRNQDGVSYDIYQLCALAEDRNGQMWIGTDKGLFVLQNPKKFFDTNVTFTQIKVPRNDGTGLADYLLSNIYIQAIAVDGANRKWIGTKDNGIYLISADGLETIHHFTTENSHLPSNSIVSIAIEGETGRVYIGTDKGLSSYMSDATEPSPILKESALHAYPNPVREDYTGNISVTGFTKDCNVKIVDSAGTLIYETTSTGGQITWNGCNMRGDRVSAGIYYVLAYDETGDEGATTKIMIIR